MRRNIAKSVLAVLLCGLLCTFSGCKEKEAAPSDSSFTQVTSSYSTSSESVMIEEPTDTAEINTEFSNRDTDPSYDEATATKITLSGSSASVTGEGAAVEGGRVTVTAEGSYLISGTLTDGQIIVRVGDSDKVQLVLSNANITNSSGAAILIESGDKVFLTLAANTANNLSDGASYTASVEDTNVDAPLFSKSDLTINGNGSLELNGNYKHGAVSKDDLRITGGDITVNAVSTGINGKDCVKIGGGTLNITAGTDGIKSDNTEDTARGYVYIKAGSLNITAGTDGIQAETVARIDGGTLNITTGGGSANASTHSDGDWGFWGPQGGFGGEQSTGEDTASAKGIKAGTNLLISNADITIDSSDDALHAGADLTVDSGTLHLSSGDDGMHADTNLTIHDGTINIAKSYEGIEGYTITVNGGEINLVAGDDGFNAAGGNDQSAMGGRPGENNFTANADSDVYIQITGGKVTIDAAGDGIDSNGDVTVTGGEVYVSGPTDGGNGAFDYQYTAKISGGTFIAVGSMQMAQGFSETSTQCSILMNASANLEAGDTVSISDADGNVLLSFTPTKSYQSIVLSCPEMVLGETYTLTAGAATTELTLESIVTSNGGMGGEPGMGGNPGMGGDPGMGGPGGGHMR